MEIKVNATINLREEDVYAILRDYFEKLGYVWKSATATGYQETDMRGESMGYKFTGVNITVEMRK